MKSKRKKKTCTHCIYCVLILQAMKNLKQSDFHGVSPNITENLLVSKSWCMLSKCQNLQDQMEALFDSCPGSSTAKGKLGRLRENSKICRHRKYVQRNFKYLLFKIQISFNLFIFYTRDSLELVEYRRYRR